MPDIECRNCHHPVRLHRGNGDCTECATQCSHATQLLALQRGNEVTVYPHMEPMLPMGAHVTVGQQIGRFGGIIRGVQ